jgi:hypothetical protein
VLQTLNEWVYYLANKGAILEEGSLSVKWGYQLTYRSHELIARIIIFFHGGRVKAHERRLACQVKTTLPTFNSMHPFNNGENYIEIWVFDFGFVENHLALVATSISIQNHFASKFSLLDVMGWFFILKVNRIWGSLLYSTRYGTFPQ